MLPSLGSMSMPALVPHCRPAGSSPQFLVTFGVGFGNPSPVMKLAAREGFACSVDAVIPAAISTTQAPNAGIKGSVLDMTPPGVGRILIAIGFAGKQANRRTARRLTDQQANVRPGEQQARA